MNSIKKEIPNMLTFSRVLILPVAFFYLLHYQDIADLSIAIVLIMLASFTDFLDGYLSRKWNCTSDFGAFWDPFADKLLMWGLLVTFAFIDQLYISLICPIIIIIRDVFCTWLRVKCKEKDIPFKTAYVAKVKTALQMSFSLVILAFMLFNTYYMQANNLESYQDVWLTVLEGKLNFLLYLPKRLVELVTIVTLYSGIDYLIRYRKVFKS